MTRRLLVPLVALLGLIVAGVVVVEQSRTPQPGASQSAVPSPPYPSFVAGAGVIEAKLGNIEIGSPVSGIVSEVMVQAGDHVHTGDPLFRLDTPLLQAQLSTAGAKLKVATAEVAQPQHQIDYSEGLRRRDPDAVSDRQLTDLRDQMAVAEAKQRLAEAEVAQIKTDIARHLIRAPADGQVLRSTLRPGEYLAAGGTAPLLLFGEGSSLYLRVDVDESEAWRIRPGAAAVAFGRGARHIRVPLRFEYIEPYVVPKTALTGQSTERSDTRVLQILYSFDHGDKPLYVGELMDVFIQAAPDDNGAH